MQSRKYPRSPYSHGEQTQALGVESVTAEQRIVTANSDQIRMERNKVRFRCFSAACQIANEIMSAGQTRSLVIADNTGPVLACPVTPCRL